MRVCVRVRVMFTVKRKTTRKNGQAESRRMERWQVAPRQESPFLPCWDQLPESGLWGSLPPAPAPGLRRATPCARLAGQGSAACTVSHSNSPERALPQDPGLLWKLGRGRGDGGGAGGPPR